VSDQAELSGEARWSQEVRSQAEVSRSLEASREAVLDLVAEELLYMRAESLLLLEWALRQCKQARVVVLNEEVRTALSRAESHQAGV